MKIFTDKIETSFFKTDEYVKNLHAIEVNSIEEFINYSLDPAILLGIESLMVGRFDELATGNPVLDSSDEPELHGEWIDIDFIADMKLLDILHEITKFSVIDFESLSESELFSVVESWINDDEDQVFTISTQDDVRQLRIILRGNSDELDCDFIAKNSDTVSTPEIERLTPLVNLKASDGNNYWFEVDAQIYGISMDGIGFMNSDGEPLTENFLNENWELIEVLKSAATSEQNEA